MTKAILAIFIGFCLGTAMNMILKPAKTEIETVVKESTHV